MGGGGEGRGVLPKMTYTGRLRPKGVPFSGFQMLRYMTMTRRLSFFGGPVRILFSIKDM